MYVMWMLPTLLLLTHLKGGLRLSRLTIEWIGDYGDFKNNLCFFLALADLSIYCLAAKLWESRKNRNSYDSMIK